jgi:Lon protease-like protein
VTNFIPLFPLGIVVFPGEHLNLHIFEPRYKQLILDCATNKKPFGIPTVLHNTLMEMGTLVHITEVVKIYEDGKMDIKTKGDKVFRILENIQTIPDKLYDGAIVNYPDNLIEGNKLLMDQLIIYTRQLHKHLRVEKIFNKPDINLNSYDIAHHIGLSHNEEYLFLELLHELQRQEYLKRHLRKVLPIVSEMESLRNRVKLNGHFKNLRGLE